MKSGPTKNSLQLRNKQITARLTDYGIDQNIQNVYVLDETQYDYVTPYEAAERMLILLAVAFSAYNFNDSEKVMDWLKMEGLWKSASDNEKEFFRTPDPEDEQKQLLSWRFEAAYMIAWALNKVSYQADPRSECVEEQVNDFLKNVPAVGSDTEEFLAELSYRSLAEITDENMFYEMAVRYFDDIKLHHKENTSPVHHQACMERHKALKWLLRYGGEADWDIITDNGQE